MKKILVITEKPSVAEDIAKVLGAKRNGDVFENEKFTITFALGHLVTLCEPEDYDKRYKFWNLKDLPIIPEEFKLKPIKEVKDRFLFIKKLLKSKDFEFVVNACDAGREGELIFRFIYTLSGSKLPIKRLWLNALTPEEIKKGFDNLKDGEELEPLSQSAWARAESDWLIGINATRAFTRKEGLLFSLGRVQTPTLAIVVKREKEIISFKPKKFFELFVDFNKNSFNYRGKWFKEKEERIFNKKLLEEILKKIEGNDGVVESVLKRKNKVLPPLLFDLTELQREANRRFGYSAKRTLKIAQALYEKHKVITYPRTDSRYLPSSMKKEAKKTLKKISNFNREFKQFIKEIEKVGIKFTKRIINDEKVTDHFAIIPTGKMVSNLSKEENNIFDLVVKRFIAVFYPEAEFLNIKIITDVNGEKFKTDSKFLISPGWMKVYGFKEESIPSVPVKKNDVVKVVDKEVKEGETKPPPRYTDATLLSAMEGAGKLVSDEDLRELLKEKGLGTPATRASIIERLIEVGYLERVGKQLKPLPKGMKLIESLERIPLTELLSPELTGEWEKKLREIERGEFEYEKFMAEIQELTTEVVEKIKEREGKRIKDEIYKEIGKCPICGGRIIDGEKSYFCENWKKGKCKFIVPKKMMGRKITREEVVELMKNRKTPLLAGFWSKNRRRFSAYLEIKNGKVELTFPEDKVIPGEPLGECPNCKGKVIETERRYRCENESCNFSLSKNILGHKLTREEVKILLSGEKTDKISFFSKGRRFLARLSLENGKLKFHFEEGNGGKGNSKKNRNIRRK